MCPKLEESDEPQSSLEEISEEIDGTSFIPDIRTIETKLERR